MSTLATVSHATSHPQRHRRCHRGAIAARLRVSGSAACVAAGSAHHRRARRRAQSRGSLKPLGDSWPTYSGDYSGRRYSALTQINQSNVKNLTLAWTARLTADRAAAAAAVRPAAADVIVGGVGDNEFVGGATTVKGAILSVNGVLYVTAPDNVWALDAHDGHLLWRYFWRTRGGTHIGNRGAAMWRNYLFFVTPDDYLISLDARTGKERWHKEIANFNQQYFLTSAPVVVDNHVIVGTGNDLDSPGFLQSFDPETGDLQWKFYTVPMNPGDPGLETWKDLDAARNGGGHPWLPGAYDPETRLYIFGTGNPTPAYMSAPRGEGLDNLFTCAIVAVHVDTGKMAWYFQTSPHEMHDWDSAQTPVLVDGTINGKPRKLVVTASRNGYYFTLDRLTGERLVTSSVLGHGELGEGPQRARASRFAIPRRIITSAARSCRRPTAARRTGRRRRSAPTPACSTCRPPRTTRCTT